MNLQPSPQEIEFVLMGSTVPEQWINHPEITSRCTIGIGCPVKKATSILDVTRNQKKFIKNWNLMRLYPFYPSWNGYIGTTYRAKVIKSTDDTRQESNRLHPKQGTLRQELKNIKRSAFALSHTVMISIFDVLTLPSINYLNENKLSIGVLDVGSINYGGWEEHEKFTNRVNLYTKETPKIHYPYQARIHAECDGQLKFMLNASAAYKIQRKWLNGEIKFHQMNQLLIDHYKLDKNNYRHKLVVGNFKNPRMRNRWLIINIIPYRITNA